MDTTPLRTVVAVPPTPFLRDGNLDLRGFSKVLARISERKITAITVAGNTGEFGALSSEEIYKLTESAVAALPRGTSILVGTGGDLATAVRVAERSAAAGVFGVVIHEPVGPFRSSDGWVQYHATIAGAVPALAVVPYVRDTRFVATELVSLTEQCENVVAVKYAVPDPVRFAGLVADGPPELLWICGLAEMWAPFFWQAGARAFTSGLVVVAPELSLILLDHLRTGDWSAALRMWHLLRPFEELRARRTAALNVPAVKEALAQLGVAGRTVRPPISELDHTERAEIAEILHSWKQATGGVAA